MLLKLVFEVCCSLGCLIISIVEFALDPMVSLVAPVVEVQGEVYGAIYDSNGDDSLADLLKPILNTATFRLLILLHYFFLLLFS